MKKLKIEKPFIAKVRQSETYKKLKDLDDFETVSIVDLRNPSNFDSASGFIYSTQIEGKARRKVIDPENHFCFEFEKSEDALIFMLKFLG